MNPDYLWLIDGMQLLTFFVAAPVLAVSIVYAARRGKPRNFDAKRYGPVCVASGVTALLLFGFAKWVNADVRSPRFFVQLACVLLSGLLFGAFMGCGFCVFLSLWHSHKTTRLNGYN
jgi:hypothetical protein